MKIVLTKEAVAAMEEFASLLETGVGMRLTKSSRKELEDGRIEVELEQRLYDNAMTMKGNLSFDDFFITGLAMMKPYINNMIKGRRIN